MLERIDDAIFSLGIAFDRARDTFDALRSGVVFGGTDADCHPEDGRHIAP